jgi:SAM-dependent methyltransferase
MAVFEINRSVLRWRLAVVWTWLWHFSSDQMQYEIRQLGRSSESYTQGETPASVLRVIAEKTGMDSGARVLDVGCGRGSALAYWARGFGVAPIGIEEVPALGGATQALFNALSISGTVIVGNYETVEWPDADVIYVAGTCFSPSAVRELQRKLSHCSAKSKIAVITLELPLRQFDLIESVPVRFPWGKTMLRIYEPHLNAV